MFLFVCHKEKESPKQTNLLHDTCSTITEPPGRGRRGAAAAVIWRLIMVTLQRETVEDWDSHLIVHFSRFVSSSSLCPFITHVNANKQMVRLQQVGLVPVLLVESDQFEASRRYEQVRFLINCQRSYLLSSLLNSWLEEKHGCIQHRCGSNANNLASVNLFCVFSWINRQKWVVVILYVSPRQRQADPVVLIITVAFPLILLVLSVLPLSFIKHISQWMWINNQMEGVQIDQIDTDPQVNNKNEMFTGSDQI